MCRGRPCGATVDEMPIEPPATAWTFGDPRGYDALDDLVGIGADLEPGTLLAA